ncbi:MAG: hypothetical protein HWE14_07970 [Flavobacteriia bacterium]|nr:hypothetical protein [Flavobacteriia bacterium]
MKNPESVYGDFLSRIWAIAGPPNYIGFEGFSYTFRDTETNLIFSVYSAGSGPAYGGRAEQSDSLLPVIRAFDRMLDTVTPAYCEIQFDTDYGKMTCGAKDGVPYDRLDEW